MASSVPEFEYLPQEGEMVGLLRSTDWSRSSLGMPGTWPETLRLQLNVCFDSQFPIAIWWGPDLVQFYNDAYRPILGATKHPAAFGRPAVETWPEIWPTIGSMVEQVVQRGIAVRGDDMPLVLDRNGFPELCHFTFSYSPIRSVDGRIDGMFTAAVETTARVLAERRQAFQLTLADRLRGLVTADDIIATATELVRQHLDVARVYYAEVDDEAGTFRIDQRWTQSGDLPELPSHGNIADFGAHLLQTLRANEAIVVDDIGADPHLRAFAGAFGQLGIASMVIVPLFQSGRWRCNFNVVHALPRRWSQADVALIADVAERTWNAVERGRAEEALRMSSQLKDEFLAMLAHELRNPLAPISAAADLLSALNQDMASIRKTSAVIKRQVAHMTGLVDDLLDISRVTRGLITLESNEIDLRDILADAVDQVRPLMALRGHTLQFDLPPAAAIVRGDRKRLVQVVANLLNNAAKYTPAGGHLTLSVTVQDSQASVAVTDDGIDMDADLVGRAFELFTQGKRNADRSQGGLGIGLALVKTLVELHGGTVRARSEGLDRGSEFIVTLPTIAPAAPGPVTRPAAHALAAPLKVLLVDDNVDAALMLAMLLESAGHDVAVDHTCGAALQRAPSMVPDVCLLDIGLPDLDGYELARRLRAEPATGASVLVAVTGYGQQSDRDAARGAGFDHHFTKPVDGNALMALLADLRGGS
ncbi:ATP-binding protein [Massilia sp. TWR1-2-2]|uniref:hybrid sensor histidine kinase/response regulator n=1 Tax=Massilia sp. TWR1-2-2 TaxID=2804584 RepID=UPI003CE7167B